MIHAPADRLVATQLLQEAVDSVHLMYMSERVRARCVHRVHYGFTTIPYKQGRLTHFQRKVMCVWAVWIWVSQSRLPEVASLSASRDCQNHTKQSLAKENILLAYSFSCKRGVYSQSASQTRISPLGAIRRTSAIQWLNAWELRDKSRLQVIKVIDQSARAPMA